MASTVRENSGGASGTAVALSVPCPVQAQAGRESNVGMVMPSDSKTRIGAGHETVTCDTDALNVLLRGEVAAVEAYDLVIPKFEGQPQAGELLRIRDEHTDAAGVLRERVKHFGGEPVERSGAWGTFTAAVTGAAKILGPATALGALKQGEEYGIGQYENALADPEINSDDKELIRYRLLPRCRSHVADLKRMIQAVNK
jgi:hypothetical protein